MVPGGRWKAPDAYPLLIQVDHPGVALEIPARFPFSFCLPFFDFASLWFGKSWVPSIAAVPSERCLVLSCALKPVYFVFYFLP